MFRGADKDQSGIRKRNGFLKHKDLFLEEQIPQKFGVKRHKEKEQFFCREEELSFSELGTCQYCRDNVTMFSGHKVVGYCIIILYSLPPFGYRDI